jgi:DivIVA domain-containing protein
MTMTDQLPAIRSNSAFKQAIVGGYDRDEVDEYVARLERRIEELEQQRSPDGAVQRALEQVGDEVAGILQRAHETAAQLTEGARAEADQLLESARREASELRESSRREAQELTEKARSEADERIGASHRDAAALTASAEARLQELDVDADRIWGERERILADVRFMAQQLVELADAAAERFPADEIGEETEDTQDAGLPAPSGVPELGEGAGPEELGEATQTFDLQDAFDEDGFQETVDQPAVALPEGDSTAEIQPSEPEGGEDPKLAGN